ETPVIVPWLPDVKLLIVDGFFDFTPIQGEILRLLIPRIPDVAINLNRDAENPEIFRAFDQTLEQLNAMAEFETIQAADSSEAAGALAGLRKTLFNTARMGGPPWPPPESNGKFAPELFGGGNGGPIEQNDNRADPRANLRSVDCSDRETEIRAMTRKIKRLVSPKGYDLSKIALVVRQKASYADIINRIFDEEMTPFFLERRVDLAAAPAVR